MLRYGIEKSIATVPLCFVTMSVEQKEIIFGIVFILIIDTILGVYVALHHRRFDSHKLRRLTSKIGQYTLAMLSAWVLTAIYPTAFGWVFHGVGIFIILTELLSNFEKLALLGMVVPMGLIAKINKEYEKLLNDNDHAEAIMEKIDRIR